MLKADILCVWCVCVCVCTHVHVNSMQVCAHVYGSQKKLDVFLYVTLCLIPLRQGLSLILKVGWWPASPSDFPASPHSPALVVGS